MVVGWTWPPTATLNCQKYSERLEAKIVHCKESSFCFYLKRSRQKNIHTCTRLGNEKSSVKTRIRIWWAHRECRNASACNFSVQRKQPAHVRARLLWVKLLSISLWCPFLLLQTFVPPATTDAIPLQDLIHKHSIRISGLQTAALPVLLSSLSCCKERGLSFAPVINSHKK